ncbi:MAG: outer membrane protein assembly factor BamA [Planctomycetota bacterium]
MTARKACSLAMAMVCLLGMLPPLRAQAGAERIVEVRVTGNEVLNDESVRGMIKTRPGMAYREDLLREDERRLLATGRFSSVSATRTLTDEGVVVTFVVEEYPPAGEVVFRGNKVFPDAELAKAVGLGPGAPLSPYALQAAEQKIRSMYQQKGYPNARVNADQQAARAGRQVVFRIVEGGKVRVDDIRFEGNDAYWDWSLKRQVGSDQRLWPFVPGHLDMEQVAQDVVSLRNFYISEGYLDAEVGRRVEYSEDRDEVVLTFLIHEGPRFMVNELEFGGNEIFSDRQLARRIELGRGEYLQQQVLQQDIERLENSYGEIGHIRAQVEAQKRYLSPEAPLPPWAKKLDEVEPGLADLIFSIREGEQYSVGDVRIHGNTVTQDRVIRRELSFFPGQVYNESAVNESERRLRQSALFREVRITSVDQPGNVEDVVVEVVEGQTARFMIGAGVSSSSGLLGNIALQQRNFDLFDWPGSFREFVRGEAFKGAGQTFSLQAEPGSELSRYSVEWEDPRLMDSPYSLGTRAFLFNRDYDEYTEERYGGNLSVGRQFRNHWYAELSGRLARVELTDLDDFVPQEILDDADPATLAGAKITLVRDRTDSRWLPTEGDRLRVNYEQVMGDYTFGNLHADYRRYWTVHQDALGRPHVLAGRVASGHIFGEAPVYEKYYGGGLGSVRGFDYRGISPRAGTQDDPIGGDWLLLGGVEYSFPLVGEQLRGVAFVDTGTAEEDLELTTYRVAVGFGFRLTMDWFGPVPMALDFGFPIVEDEEDEEQMFNFSIGWMF